MKFDVKERLLLLNLLPKEGDVTSLRIVLDLRRSLSFSEKELKLVKFKSTGQQITWDPSKNTIKEIPIGEVASKMIQESFKQLDEKKKLSLDMLPLYDRFHNTKKEVKNG